MGTSSVRGEGTRPGVQPPDERGGDGLPADGGEGGNGRAARGGTGGTRPATRTGSGGPAGPRAGRRRGGPRRHGRRGKRRILRWVASVLSLLILGTAGAGYLYYRHLNSNIKSDKLNLGKNKMAEHKANAAGQTPLNILLIGSDARNTDANKALGGAKDTFDGPPLADVQMLVHVSADRSNMSVVSMPRDTMLKLPECENPESGETFRARNWGQTNESLMRGGPGCTVATWYELTGITIDHFMMVDFAGVVSMADAIGGVPVCVTDNVHSRNSRGQGSGLKLEKGTHPIKGEQALQWLRTRYGFGDGSDLYRTRAQHMYMNSMVRELRKNTKLTDPNKLRKLAEAATSALTVDEGLDTVGKLYDLAEEFKKVPTERITMTTMPNFYSKRSTGRVEPLQPDAEQVFRMIREDVPLDGRASKRKSPAPSKDTAAPPADIGVTVRNGTYTDELGTAQGRATDIAEALSEKGFTRATADRQTDPEKRTVVYFPSAELEGDAQAVAKALGIPVASVKKSTEVTGVTVVVGADWREGDAYPKPKVDDNKTPTSSNPLNGANDKACMQVDPNFTWR
ncbi:LCP family protein [Streptomyces sp. NPDC000410]|uniref:LCP family protein n=1 Tax=Streptomyces sp. NPDC000410 TaxID=3154254 RepID=UPI0033290FE3